MATLKEKLESLTPEQREELKDALGMDKSSKEDFSTMIGKLADRITALEKPPKKPAKKSWWDDFWNGPGE